MEKNESAIVVGAGIIGIACAYYLNKAGYQVTVIDQGKVGAACSHANCGYVCPSHILPLARPGLPLEGVLSLFNRRAPFRLKPQFSLFFLVWVYQFLRHCNFDQMMTSARHLRNILDASMHEYGLLMANRSLDCEWSTHGLMYVFQSRKAMRKFGSQDDLLGQNFGVYADRISQDRLAELEPALKSDLAGAYLYKNDASLHPGHFVASWVTDLKSTGVQFIEGCTYESMCLSNQSITSLNTSLGKFSADHYIFAAGAWSGKLSADLPVRLPVEAGKGYSITMDRPTNCPTFPMLFPEKHVGLSPFQNGFRIGSMMEFCGFDSTVPEYRVRQLESAAKSYLVQQDFGPIREKWFGWRPMTWDSLPIIGRISSLDNVVIATGHNMLGVSLATSTGKLVEEIIGERPTHIDAKPFSPSRFAT